MFTDHPALVRLVEKLIRDETYLAAIYERFGGSTGTEFGPHLVALRTRLLPPDQAEDASSPLWASAPTTTTSPTPSRPT